MQVFFSYSESMSALFSLLAHALTDPSCTNMLHPFPRYCVGRQMRAQTRMETGAQTNCTFCCLWGAWFLMCNVPVLTSLIPVFSPD